jgi:hypothetical protein
VRHAGGVHIVVVVVAIVVWIATTTAFNVTKKVPREDVTLFFVVVPGIALFQRVVDCGNLTLDISPLLSFVAVVVLFLCCLARSAAILAARCHGL